MGKGRNTERMEAESNNKITEKKVISPNATTGDQNIGFIDFKKAFNSVNREQMWRILRLYMEYQPR
jgi:hypothetical protein